MRPQSEDELADLIINWVRENKQTNGSTPVAINRETDLLKSGLLDSFGFIDLIVFIESHNGFKVELTDVDPEEFSVVRGLSRIVMRNHE
ncbi:MAG: hypothetical protein DMG49_02560 [Acidobacteria bacterium]|nr:MAG: hypothetical protein DMG49_02560 [Acidobacteriota bacterium]